MQSKDFVIKSVAAPLHAGEDFMLAASAILFCTPLAYYLAFRLVRRVRLFHERKVLIFGGALSVLLAVVLMMTLGNTGAIFAFTAFVGGFYGARRGGEVNALRAKHRSWRRRRK